MKWYYLLGLAVVAALAFAFIASPKNADTAKLGETIEVYYSQTCGCCANYQGYLRSSGLNVKSISSASVDGLKDSLNVPANVRSCHTSKVAGYFVEGHVPVEAIKKLLAEKPDIDGIALGGMPSG